MKTKLTINTLTCSIFIAFAIMLSSCSTSNQLSSQSPHYHLNLVKANTYSSPPNKKGNDNTTSDIAPLSHHSSMVSYQSNEQLNEITGLLKTNMKLIKKETKKSSPGIYKEIKHINLNKTLQLLAKSSSINNRSSVNNTDSTGYPGRDFGLFILFLLLAILFWILAIGAPLFWIFGTISFIASVVFFILWIVALA